MEHALVPWPVALATGILALIALVLVIMGCVGAYQADDAGGDVPTSMIVTILTGVGILAVREVHYSQVHLNSRTSGSPQEHPRTAHLRLQRVPKRANRAIGHRVPYGRP